MQRLYAGPVKGSGQNRLNAALVVIAAAANICSLRGQRLLEQGA